MGEFNICIIKSTVISDNHVYNNKNIKLHHIIIYTFYLPGYQTVQHTGSYNSYICFLTLLPEVSIGVWACTNSHDDTGGTASTKIVSQFALDLLLGKISFIVSRLIIIMKIPIITTMIIEHGLRLYTYV